MHSEGRSIVLGAGPMGRTIAETLAAKKVPVTVVTRDGRAISGDVDVARADLSDPAQTSAACRGADVIYFCAAPPYHQWSTAFPALQEAAIAAAAQTGAVLVAVENLYGYGVAGTLHEGMPLEAKTRKGAVRAQMSKRLLAAHETGEARCVAGRATDFFGPGVPMSALGERFWPALLAGKTIDWVGDPDAPHSFAYLPDLAKAYVDLGERSGTWGRAWHLPALPPISVRELCARVRGSDATIKIRKTPSWVLRAVGVFQPAARELIEMRYMFDEPFEIDHSDFDGSVGPTETNWETAINATVAWWSSQEKQAA
ncbi:MAG: NAD-dependent epimerase/dehydratase family protein [Rhodobacter sp.]|nr:NAD-dependent epimerase/dehydratase family protein [Rhodobacter sp.]